jgi:hypothetical protein
MSLKRLSRDWKDPANRLVMLIIARDRFTAG